MDDKLSFKSHIDIICSKISRNVGVLYRMSYFVPESVLLNVYYAIIYPYLTYCNIAWGGAAAVHISKLLAIQKKAIRIITHSGYLDHTDPLFFRTNILKINDIYNHLCCCLAYKSGESLLMADHLHYTRGAASFFYTTISKIRNSATFTFLCTSE